MSRTPVCVLKASVSQVAEADRTYRVALPALPRPLPSLLLLLLPSRPQEIKQPSNTRGTHRVDAVKLAQPVAHSLLALSQVSKALRPNLDVIQQANDDAAH